MKNIKENTENTIVWLKKKRKNIKKYSLQLITIIIDINKNVVELN